MLFNANHYMLYFGHLCNYSCSYCVNHASTNPQISAVMRSVDRVEQLLREHPGCVAVSGGEPLLWKGLPILMDLLPEHGWIIYTNASLLPPWVDYDSIRFFVVAWHPEQADGLKPFIERTLQLRRAVVKILAWPGREQKAVADQQAMCEAGLVAHLVPCEWPRGWSEDFLEHVRQNPTSLLYNSRFFTSGSSSQVICKAGTRAMFQINPSGKLGRCSQSVGEYGTIFVPRLAFDSRLCSVASCYCEWHHFACAAPANDNEAWEHFVDTGEWPLPSPAQLTDFVETMDGH